MRKRVLIVGWIVMALGVILALTAYSGMFDGELYRSGFYSGLRGLHLSWFGWSIAGVGLLTITGAFILGGAKKAIGR